MLPPSTITVAAHARPLGSRGGARRLACVLLAAGCAGSPPPSSTTPEVVARPGELRMRDPAYSPAAAARLGELETVRAPSAQADSRLARSAQRPAVAAVQTPLAPIRIAASAAPRAYALRDGSLVLPGGLIIHNVPKGVGVRTAPAADGGELWELVDARGRRVALLKAEAIRRGSRAPGDLLTRTSAARSVGQRSDWGASPVKVVTDRFLGENYVYTIERRADGTGWIWGGLELATCGSKC